MKVIIDISDEDFEFNMNCCPDLTDLMVIYNAIRKGKSLPDNATNGDVIKALFPNENIKLSSGFYESYSRNISFKYDWWNAPYTKEQNNDT